MPYDKLAGMASKRTKKRASEYMKTFNYTFYELTQTLKINSPVDYCGKGKSNVSVVSSAFQETSACSLLALLCKDGSLLLQLFEGLTKPVIKQFKWFQNPHKKITCFSIDPLHAAWILCGCCDTSVYLLPSLAYLKDPSDVINSPQKWSLTDLTRVGPLKLSGMPTALIWWHTIEDRNICIVGTELGEIVFVDLATLQEAMATSVREAIARMELLQDVVERISYLIIHTKTESTLQLLLEGPSHQITSFNSPTNFTTAFNMGYDTVNEFATENILTFDTTTNKDDFLPVKIKAASQESNISVQRSKDQVFFVRHNTKYQTIEIHNDLERMPVYSYQLPANASMYCLTNQITFAITKRGSKSKLVLLSNRFVSTPAGADSLTGKKKDENSGELQAFILPLDEPVLQIYGSRYCRPAEWDKCFPYDTNFQEHALLCKCILVTTTGVLEVKPRISPESYFSELAITNDFGIAEAFGMTMDLNISLLCKCLAERELKHGNVQAASKFYGHSEVSPSERAANLMLYSSVTESLLFIRQAMKQQRSNSPREKKKLANMAVTCYVHQILDKRSNGSFRKTIEESFRLFLRDNFDYDEKAALELLLSFTMVEELFEVAKARGVIEEALKMMSGRGLFLLDCGVQHLLLDRGYAEVVCTLNDGVFLDHMSPEEAAKFLIMKPDITDAFVKRIDRLLPNLEENMLVQVTRVFDPSRLLIKPYIERAHLISRKRSPSLFSLTSVASSISQMDDSNTPSCEQLLDTFIKAIIYLNMKRYPEGFSMDIKQSVRYISGQQSWSSMLHKQGSFRSTEQFTMVDLSTLACGKHHVAFITQDGDLYTWGKAIHGRLGHGDIIEERGTAFPFCVESLHMHGIQVLGVACGAAHTVAVCKEGVYSWGLNKYGQLGTGDFRKRSRPCLVTAMTSQHVLSVTCGYYHTLAISSNNCVWAWGWGIHGQLGTGRVENANVPSRALLPEMERVAQAAAGYAHSAILASSGHVYTFGASFYGQLGNGSNHKKTMPQFVAALEGEAVYIIACGPFETVAITEDQVIFVWGRNQKQYHICSKVDSAQYGRQLASSLAVDISHHYYPYAMAYQLSEPIQMISCGNWHYIAMTTTGQVYTWGCNDCGQLGHYNKTDQNTPRLVKALNKRLILSVAAGGEFSIAVDSEGRVFAWGRADSGQLGLEGSAYKDTVPPGNRKSPIAVLSPTQVPGLPIVAEEGSLTSGTTTRRDAMLDRDTDLPDFSAIGRGSNPYSSEALLVALQRLYGSYNCRHISRLLLNMKLWFPASFTLRLRQEWREAFMYDLKALECQYKTEDASNFVSDLCLLLEDIFRKIEDFMAEAVDEMSLSLSVAAFLVKVIATWKEKLLPFNLLEEILGKRLEIVSPYLIVILFRCWLQASEGLPETIEIVFMDPAFCKIDTSLFSVAFLVQLIKATMEQISLGNCGFSFLLGDKGSSFPLDSNNDALLSAEAQLKELLVSYIGKLHTSTNIYLTSTTAATLSAASSAAKANPLEPWVSIDVNSSSSTTRGKPDSVIFSCSHNFPSTYLTDVIVPEFQLRMSDLPVPLPSLAASFIKEYRTLATLISAACPCCVYNSLRQEQLQLLQVAGHELNGNKSTFWEM